MSFKLLQVETLEWLWREPARAVVKEIDGRAEELSTATEGLVAELLSDA